MTVSSQVQAAIRALVMLGFWGADDDGWKARMKLMACFAVWPGTVKNARLAACATGLRLWRSARVWRRARIRELVGIHSWRHDAQSWVWRSCCSQC